MKRLGIRPNHEYCTGEKGTRGIVLCGTQGATTDCDDISDMNKGNRPAINEEFDPDYDCLFDTFQLKCIPGSNQECPKGFSVTIPENCVPLIGKNGNWECPKDYHSVESSDAAHTS